MGKFLSFLKSTAGSTGTMLALSAVPMLGAAGAAIDFANRYNTETELQMALDGAALAAASAMGISDSARETIAKDYFAKAAIGTAFEGKVPAILAGSGSVKVELELEVPTILATVLGIDNLPAKGVSESLIVNEGKVEITLVLDFSGSMNAKNKYQDMQDAAENLLTSLAEQQSGDNLKVGLVPFSAMVRTTMDSSYVSQATNGDTWTGCTQDQKYPHNTTVYEPSGAADTLFGYIENSYENRGNYGCAAYANKKLDIVPMTTDIDSVISKLNAMKPLGNTNIALGAQFGWMLLDPAEPYTQGSSYTATDTSKYMILLTDGIQTSKQFDVNGNRSVSAAEANLLTLCAGMRAKDITIYTIAYDITDPQVTNLLKTCSANNYYEPEAGTDDINVVFQDISSKIKNEFARLTK